MAMNLWILGRYAFGIGLAGVMLAGCGASSGGVGVPASTALNAAGKHQKTFSYTGAEQKFTVPSGVKSIKVDASGAAGAGLKLKRLGRGGRVVATVPVTQGETLYVFVGGQGTTAGGGFNGGATGGNSGGDGGGGASDLREGGTGLSNRIIVAGGGGGEGVARPSAGGLGGGLVGGAGQGTGKGPGGGGGGGGTQSQGGAGGVVGTSQGSNPGSPGALGIGGTGGTGFSCARPGGGGGGGYYGGGGGGSGSEGYNCNGGPGGGGGGGSSYTEPNATGVQMWQGWQAATGNGVIVVSW